MSLAQLTNLIEIGRPEPKSVKKALLYIINTIKMPVYVKIVTLQVY